MNSKIEEFGKAWKHPVTGEIWNTLAENIEQEVQA